MTLFGILSYVILFFCILYINKAIKEADIPIPIKGRIYLGTSVIIAIASIWISLSIFL